MRAALEHALAGHGGEVLGRAAGVEVECGLEVADGLLADEHADADGVSEEAEEVAVEAVDRRLAVWLDHGCGGLAGGRCSTTETARPVTQRVTEL